MRRRILSRWRGEALLHSAEATAAHHFNPYDGKPLTIPREVASPKAEYLEWHRASVFSQ